VFSNSRGKKHYKGILAPEKLDNFVDSEPNDRNRYSKREVFFFLFQAFTTLNVQKLTDLNFSTVLL